MQVTFTRTLEELTAWKRHEIATTPYIGTEPLDTSRIDIRADGQIRNLLVSMGWRHRFEVNRWFSFVSWSRAAGDPNTVRIVVEGDGPQFEVVCQAVTAELGKPD
jgi:hypothetical protein